MSDFFAILITWMTTGLINALLYVGVSLGSFVCLVLGIILTIRSNMHYKTMRRPWLLIVIGLALPAVAFIVIQAILLFVHM